MILITGAKGQLGTELRYLLDERNEEYVAVDVAEMDITNEEMVEKVFEEVKPTLVYHCAAYTAVDAAEDEGKELDFAINVTGTENVAKASEKHGATLVYISTDYVFDGKKPVGEEWEVDDRPDPQTEYGRTKRMGEELVEKYVSNFYIIRTAWVFGNYGKNFVFTMQNLAKTHKTLTVVNDQHGRPTWTRTLAEFMTYLAENCKEFFRNLCIRRCQSKVRINDCSPNFELKVQGCQNWSESIHQTGCSGIKNQIADRCFNEASEHIVGRFLEQCITD